MIEKDYLHKSCPICLSNHITHYCTIREYFIFSCYDCRLRFVSNRPMLNDKILENFYSTSYSQEGKRVNFYGDYAAEEKIHRKKAIRFLKEIIQLSPQKDNRDINLLDIGCAYGYFLDEARKINIQTAGVEISEIARNFAINNLKLEIYSDLDKLIQQRRQFDIITMFGLIEHLLNPLEELIKIRNLLKDNGFLLITTLMRNRLIGCAYKPPEHLFYFSSKSLQILFDKARFIIERKKRYLDYYSLSRFLSLTCNVAGFKNPFVNCIVCISPKIIIRAPNNEIFIIARKIISKDDNHL